MTAISPLRNERDQIPYSGLKTPLIEISKRIIRGVARNNAMVPAKIFLSTFFIQEISIKFME